MKYFEKEKFIVVIAIVILIFTRACTPIPSFAVSTPATQQEGQIGQNMTNCIENPAPCLNIPRLVAAWRQGMSMVSTTTTHWLSILEQLISAYPIPTSKNTPFNNPLYNSPNSVIEVVPQKNN